MELWVYPGRDGAASWAWAVLLVLAELLLLVEEKVVVVLLVLAAAAVLDMLLVDYCSDCAGYQLILILWLPWVNLTRAG
ncbi:hypothetical protein B0I35DRAFT_431795 [Stachybotrys elegans]|uniref:Uncharacterized protein n=1 Tax=Stachybotrys elegans TaxID=80388 RepID=A0A8K0SPT5_9HYPO|nr:hypothetical protein B0I35DRAFT_431795 [Stachybotrys elegans]